MSRLQKKCLIATTGFHLLLVLIVVFGSAFFVSHSKPDESQILTVIPTTLIDAAFNSGVQNAQPPPPSPVQPPQPIQPTPQPPQPKPEPQPEPPKQTLMEKVQEIFKPEPPKPDDSKPVEPADKPTKPTPKKIEVSLKPVVRNASKPTKDTSEADAQREAQRVRDQRAKAFRSALNNIKDNASSATTVEMRGEGSVSYANYALAVKSIYDQAWTPPENMAIDDANTKVSVTISRDGRVVSSRIISRSGDARVDASVQRALDRVNFVAPFPDGATEAQRTFIINFNPQARRSL